MTNQENLDQLLRDIADEWQRYIEKQAESAIREIGGIRVEIFYMLNDYADSTSTIKKARMKSLLRDLDNIEQMMRKTGMESLEKAIKNATSLASNDVSDSLAQAIGKVAIEGISFYKINKNVIRYVLNRHGNDGLVLSDRVWRLAGDQKDEISKVLRSGILRGESIDKIVANIRKVYENETWKIRRLVLTETATAQTTVSAYTAKQSKVIKALKLHEGQCGRKNHYLHKCHILAHEDRYGLGAGIFMPDDSEIYCPHPNCSSFTTYVLRDKYA